MIPLYAYSPSLQTSVRVLEGLDGSNQMDLIQAFGQLGEASFLVTDTQLQVIREQLSHPQPEGTVWGLDPSDATLSNLGVHDVADPTQLWLEVKPPYTFSHAQALQLFAVGEQVSS